MAGKPGKKRSTKRTNYFLASCTIVFLILQCPNHATLHSNTRNTVQEGGIKKPSQIRGLSEGESEGDFLRHGAKESEDLRGKIKNLIWATVGLHS